jgi:hypothetical protein
MMDDDTRDKALWNKNDHDFYTIPFRASSGYKPPQNRKMSVSPHELFMPFLSANLFEETAAETNMCK